MNKYLGIDFGSRKCVLSLLEGNVTKVLQNESSNRETDVVIVFKEKRLLGEEGSLQFTSNFNTGYRSFNRLLGQGQSGMSEQDQLQFATPPKLFEEKQFIFMMNNRAYLPQQLCSVFLKKMTEQYQNIPVIISYPDYYTQGEIRALYEGTLIAQLKLYTMISESQALNNYYRQLREFQDKYILFIDFGYSKLNAFLLLNNQVLSKIYDRNLGVRNADQMLVKWVMKKVNKNYNVEDKNYWRILEAVEKTRKSLSAGKSAQIEIENLGDDDFYYTLTREEYENIVNDVRDMLINRLSKLIQQINHRKHKVDVIELIGGGSRIPFVIETINILFEGVTQKRSLNATEVIAEGCALQGLPNNSRLQDEFQYPIRIGWSIDKDEKLSISNLDYQNSQMYRNQLTQLKIKAQKKIQLILFYDPPPIGFDQMVRSLGFKTFNSNAHITFGIRHGLVDVLECYTYINNSRTQLERLEAPYQLQLLIQIQSMDEFDDQQVDKIHEARNFYEKYIYNFKENLKDSHHSIKAREKIGSELEEMQVWFESKQHPPIEYQIKIEQLIQLYNELI